MYTMALGEGCMSGGCGGGCQGAGVDGKREPENRTRGAIGFESEESPMLLDDRAAQRQAQAHAFGLGREEGREELLLHFRGDARADVSHRELQPRLARRERSAADPA